MESSFQAESNEAGVAADAKLHPRLDGRPPGDDSDALQWRRRARWLRRCLDDMGERPRHMLILGGDRSPANSELFGNLHIKSLLTIDVARARVNCDVDLHVVSDGPLTIHLAGCSRTVHVT